MQVKEESSVQEQAAPGSLSLDGPVSSQRLQMPVESSGLAELHS